MDTMRRWLSSFPDTHYLLEAHLLAWHPRGLFNDTLAERVVEFIELEERIENSPFNRYLDFSGIMDVHLKVAHTFWIAERRRSGYAGPPVKCAIFADATVTFALARLYEELMQGAALKVRAFRTREEAAEWLQVRVALLIPEF